MPAALQVRSDYTAGELRKLSRTVTCSRQSGRLLSIAAIYDGMSRADAARIGGMDRQTLRDWVIRFNEAGPDGLKDRWNNGSVRRLSADQLAELAVIVETGPDLNTDGVVRWRRVDLKRVIEERFGVVYSQRYVSQILHDLDFSHMSARPQHPKQDERVIKAFKKTSPTRSPRT
jgi:transposase